MRRVEMLPEELQEIEDALSRAATPMHEQPTIEFDSREVIRGLQRSVAERLETELVRADDTIQT